MSYPLRLSEESLQADYGEISPALVKVGAIQPAGYVTDVECPGHSACLKTFSPHNGKFYINCDCEEGMGLVEVNKAKITRFEVALKSLLEWIAIELNLSGGVQLVREEDKEGTIWSLGKRRGGKSAVHFYFHRTTSPDQAHKFSREVQKENPIILWLGEQPHTGLFPKNIVPLEDVLKSRKTGLFLNRNILSKLPNTPRHAAGENTIVLGKNMGMEKQGESHYLLFDREGDTFRFRERIRPQAYRMIRFLYDVRNRKEHSFNLDVFVEREFVTAKTVASDRIREIKAICEEKEAEHIFHAFPDNKWGLNPLLEKHDS